MNTKLFGICGEPFEFEWNIFRGRTSVDFLKGIQIKMATRKTRPEEFEDHLHVDVQRY